MNRWLAGTAMLLALWAPAVAHAQPPVRHIFVIVLENKGYDETFGPSSKAPYLSKTLTSMGALIPGYYGIGHLSLDNYVAMVSGQAPNPQTQSDCQFFTEFLPGIAGPSDGQYVGSGCVHPAAVKTVANQLDDKGLSWKGYMEDMKTACRHPAIGAHDDTQTPKVGDQYAARHNPFVYFHSIIDTPGCAKNDVDFSQLASDIASPATTASYSFITPNLCNDGHDEPCVDKQPGGLVSADAWLKQVVPQILSSPGYQDNGMLVITFDEAENGDASACCNEQPGYNTPNPGGPTPGPGGGKTGTVVLSQFTQPGTVSKTEYNHYSLLRSVEDIFGLAHLGYAGQAGLKPFGDDIYNATVSGRQQRGNTRVRVRAVHLRAAPRVMKAGRLTTLRVRTDTAATVTVGGACRRSSRSTRAHVTKRWGVRAPKGGGTCTVTASRRGWSSANRTLRSR
ncbi:MAG: alkaline phosphatase family protein [Thermoleophilaceae bacterium]